MEASKASLLKDAVRKCEGREEKDSESVLCKKGVIKPLSLLSFNGKAVQSWISLHYKSLMFVLVAANKASFFSLYVFLSNVKCSDIFIRQIVNSVLKLSD